MRRFLLSIGILLGLVGLCLWSLATLHRYSGHYAALASQAEMALANGDTSAALALCDQLESEWQQFRRITGIYVDGCKLDAIHMHLAGLRPLLEDGHPDALAELECIRVLAEGLYEEERPTFWQIL